MVELLCRLQRSPGVDIKPFGDLVTLQAVGQYLGAALRDVYEAILGLAWLLHHEPLHPQAMGGFDDGSLCSEITGEGTHGGVPPGIEVRERRAAP